MPLSLTRFLALLFLFVVPVLSQQLPKHIRGYTVHKDPITVAIVDRSDSAGEDAVLEIGDPMLTDVGLSGVSLSLGAKVTSLKQSGKVDFLTFHDFRVNGIPVEIDEYADAFSFQKGSSVSLPAPAVIFLPTHRLLEAGWKEIHESKGEWKITGRVFVFGRFRKLGFYHKRVVPVDISINIKNPLLSDPSGTPVTDR